MRQMSLKVCMLFLVCLLSLNTLGASVAYTVRINLEGVVSQVIDGDTFYLVSGDRVRLADINTPEIGEPGYDNAKDYTYGLVNGQTVYLDVDDVSRIDSHSRLVCVVYVDYNATHYLNLNKALLVSGLAEVWDHTNNEFDPDDWQLYVSKSTGLLSPNPTSPITTYPTLKSTPTAQPDSIFFNYLPWIILLIAIILVSIVILRKAKKST